MNKTITAYFTEAGTPKTGLTPTIRIRDVSDNSLKVTDASMTEIGDGWYKYTFTSFVIGTEYVIRCDGGATLTDPDRYVWGSSSCDVEVIRKLLMNRLELRNGTVDNWVLYDDDDTTELLKWSVTDYRGSGVRNVGGAPARRSRGQ